MTISIVAGVPGSGKTLYGVYLIAKRFCDCRNGMYYLRDDLTLVSNIDNLTLPHKKLEDFISSVDNPWSVEGQKKLYDEYGRIVYLIDEAQTYFGMTCPKSAPGWFQYHRHYDQDIFLITQSPDNIPKLIRVLCEYIVNAVPRSRSLFGFSYRFYDGKVKVGSDKITNPKPYFALYRSALSGGAVSASRGWLYKSSAIVACSVLLFGYMGHSLYTRMSPKKAALVSQPSVDRSKKHALANNSAVPKFQVNHHGRPVAESPSLPKKVWVRVSTYIFYPHGSSPVIKILYHGAYLLGTQPFKVKRVVDDFYALVDAPSASSVPAQSSL